MITIDKCFWIEYVAYTFLQEEAHIAVCEICGSSENQEVMVNCTQCNAYRHCYCLVVVPSEMKGKWCCYECQKNANGDPGPIRGTPISKVLPHSTKGEVKENVHQLQDAPREVKVSSADKRASKSWADDQHSGESAFSSSDVDVGCESGSKSLHHHIDMPVIINSSVEYAIRPEPEAICWTGCFLVSAGENNLGEFKAYHPPRVSPKVLNITKKMPNNLQLKIQRRMDYWPKAFGKTSPVYDDIALLFFPTKLDCHGKKLPCPLEIQCSFPMKAYVDDMMLLIYCSEVLPPDSQWIDGETYLWGVFVKPRPASNSARFRSIAT